MKQQGSQQQVQVEECTTRSPLTDKKSPLPRSPLFASNNNLTPKSPSLPPLKFNSSLLPRSNLAFGFNDNDSVSDDDDDDVESVTSLSCPAAETDEENEDGRVFDNLDTPIAQCYDEEQLFGFGFGFGNGAKSKTLKPSGILRKGLLIENITIQVPNSVNARRFTDGELGFNKCVQKKMTPCGSEIGTAGRGVRFQNTSNLNDSVDLATPSAPPIFIDGEGGEGDVHYSEGSVANEVDEMTQQDRRSWQSRDSVNCDDGGGRSECSIEQKPNTVAERYFCSVIHSFFVALCYFL